MRPTGVVGPLSPARTFKRSSAQQSQFEERGRLAETLKFIDLFAGLGGFHRALGDGLGHDCVFASEIEPGLKEVYKANFGGSEAYLHGDITKARDDVPAHDVLCGGFPCPSFSKSGKQHGRREKRGRLMREIVYIAKKRQPSVILLENVGNFERTGGGAAWRELRTSLEAAGYHVRATEHRATGGPGLISPHHLGHPHQRERFYVVATREELAKSPFPERSTKPTSLRTVTEEAPSHEHRKEAALTDQQVRCIEHWNELLRSVPASEPILSPLWGDEAWETYPYRHKTPWSMADDAIRDKVGRRRFPSGMTKRESVVGHD